MLVFRPDTPITPMQLPTLVFRGRALSREASEFCHKMGI